MRKAVIIFTRVPAAGCTKTRMMPSLTAEQCENLHTAFLKDIKAQYEKTDCDIFVCFTPADGQEKIRNILGEAEYFPQTDGSLGDKMYCALKTVLEKGYDMCLLTGSDIPEVKAEHIKRAFGELLKNDVVFGRTADGGYYLVGMKKPLKAPFEIGSYGHSDVWKNTLENLRRNGLSTGFTETLEDMDEVEDLDGYRFRMYRDRELARSHTAEFLSKIPRLSVIIPTYNEAKTIERLQDFLEPFRHKCQIIFADGGSSDGTQSLIRPHFRLINTKKGRARQMNEGALASSGNRLFFLHCDSLPPKDFIKQIEKALERHDAGCFGIAFDTQSLLMGICRFISNMRAKRGIMFGDQGIFIKRELFFKAGMFPEIPIMEDYRFSLTLKEKGVKTAMTKDRIITSARRFPPTFFGRIRVMWLMNRLRKRYRDGEDIGRIAEAYRDIR